MKKRLILKRKIIIFLIFLSAIIIFTSVNIKAEADSNNQHVVSVYKSMHSSEDLKNIVLLGDFNHVDNSMKTSRNHLFTMTINSTYDHNHVYTYIPDFKGHIVICEECGFEMHGPHMIKYADRNKDKAECVDCKSMVNLNTDFYAVEPEYFG